MHLSADFRVYMGGRSPDTTMHRSRARSYGGSLAQPGLEDGAAALSGPVAMQGIAATPAGGAALAASKVGAAERRAPPLANGGGEQPGFARPAAFESAGVEHGVSLSPPMPYVSTFGSLPAQLVGSSPQLNRILMTHAPYLSKLESLASSATRCVGGRVECGWVSKGWLTSRLSPANQLAPRMQGQRRMHLAQTTSR